MRALVLCACAIFTTVAHAQRVGGGDGEPLSKAPVTNLGPKVAPEGLLQRPIGITLSGGVSLGAYEAGYLHYIIRELRGLGVRPKIISGTSAGSINAFMGLIEACSAAPRVPTDSVLYRAWSSIGFQHLFIADEVTPDAVLSRKGFGETVKLVRGAWDRGLAADCDIQLGTAVTRAAPRAIKISTSDVTIPRMSERFLVRVRGQGAGRPSVVENVRTRELGRILALLPVDGPSAKPFDSILDVLQASSGVPLAFPAQPVSSCAVISKGDEVPACRPEDATPSEFIDGGLFDNRPLGLAYSALKEMSADRRPALLFIDPNMRTWPMPETTTFSRGHGVLALVTRVLFDFIDTAMSAELERLIEHEPDLQTDLFIGQVHYPPASEPMGAFFGFFERELRRFDFYLGMYNARRLVATERGKTPAQLGNEGGPLANDPAWKPLRCLRALWDADGDPAVECAGADLIDFRILAQVAGERVVNDCRRATTSAESKHPLCIAAREGKPAPRVVGVRIHGDPVFHAGETDYGWTMRRLGELGFEFRDLGLSRKHASRGFIVLRDTLGHIVDALARKQGMSSLVYSVLGAYGVDMIKYLPPKHIVHLVVGDRVEVGWSYTEPTSPLRWARLSLNLGARGLETIFSSSAAYLGIAPTAGIILEPLFLSRPSVQTRLGLHAGYMFSSGDRLLAGSCDPAHESVPCSRPLAEAVLSVAILGTLRVQLAATWLPAVRSGEKQVWSIGPGFGVQIPIAGKR